MARIACVSVPARGHIDPMAAVAIRLVERGHSVTFFHVADAEPFVASFGLPFEVVGRLTHPPGCLDAVRRNAARASTLGGARRLIRDAAGVTTMLCRELPARLRASGIDFILADQNEAAGGMVAYRLGLPFATLAAALPLNWDPSVPSPFVGWRPGDGPWHRTRNIASMKVTRAILSPLGDAIEAIVSDWRIRPGRFPEDFMSGLAQIAQLTPSLDFPRRSLTECFHYCGPLRTETTRPSSGAGRRGAFVSLGTLQGGRAELFATIAAATRACGLDTTIAHGGLLSDREAGRLSKLADVHAFVDQRAVLASSEIAVLHGGMNTVMDALSFGVPLVVIPLAFEQGAIAARVAHAGVGVACSTFGLSVSRLVAKLREVTSQPRYKRAAMVMSGEIERAGGAGRAADIIEQVIATGCPVIRSE